MAVTVRSLTTSEVAARLGVHRNTIIKWIEAGELLAWKTPGGHYRIWLSELQRFIYEKGGADERRGQGI